jgi:cellulose synthase/poly-beta-1,6-N-acetylglucosamine synthase-like glycosyltransferase
MLLYTYAVACFLLASGYLLLLRAVLRTWRSMPMWEAPADFQPSVRVSVVIAARNEAENIESCVRSVLACNYPTALREIVVVDDYSEDDTAKRVAGLVAAHPDEVRLLRLSEAHPPAPPGKKSALSRGIACACGELVVTTDADCLVPPRWLRLLASAYEKRRAGAIVAPVALQARNGWERFQALDVAATMGITGAALARHWFAMGNGANLCYPKATFQRVGGFAGNAHCASGDDMFLLAKLPIEEVFFLKNADAAVETQPCPTVMAFFQQRLRWGTKNTGWTNRRLQAVLALLWALPFAVVCNALLALWHPLLGGMALLLFGVKAWADWRLLREMTAFFHQKKNLSHFWTALLIHTAYLAVVGLASLVVRRYSWKGRRWR